MTQMDLLRAMEEKGIRGLHRQHLSNALNGNMTPLWARRIEIGLDLPKFTLVKMTGAKMKEIEILGDM